METDQAQYDAILSRLGKLEKQNRRLKWMGLFSLVALLSLATIAWETAGSKTYKGNFILTDDNGKTRGRFWVDEVGCPNLVMLNEGGAIKAWLGLFHANGAPFLNFSDENGETRASLSLNPGGVPIFTLYDEYGNVIRELPE